MSEAPPHLESQVRVSKLLGLGFVFSVVVTGGAGSLLALIIGARALILIRQSRGEVAGRMMAWWCIVAGALGAAALLPYTLSLVVRAVKP